MSSNHPSSHQDLVRQILESRKYRNLGLNPNTVSNLIRQEEPHHSSLKSLRKTVRRKLHNIVAPYLGELDYDRWTSRLTEIQNTDLNSSELRNFCLEVLQQHASTKERIPSLKKFYQRLFDVTGKPESILDLACGMHPFGIPWMGLPRTIKYHAYDIIQPRIELINLFFKKIGLQPLAENRDVLVDPPHVQADVGFFFKEAHRFEKRESGCNREFWANLNVSTLAVSLPIENLAGTHSLLEQHRQLVNENISENQGVKELIFEDEIIFLIREPGKLANV